MNPAPVPGPPPLAKAVPPAQVLRKLFLTLFLRGRSARHLNEQAVPKSVGARLKLMLFMYAGMGCLSLALIGQPVFAVSVYLHAMTFALLGMFVAASAGDILFNREEADILLHRPVDARTLLWAKVRVLVEVSLWLAGAFNLIGFLVGIKSADGGWGFPVVHAISTSLEALFCTSCVVLVYQLCLRWFGREKLEGLMTMAQILVSVAAVLGGQILPRVVFQLNHVLTAREVSWWLALLPPAWFAGFDDALAGSGVGTSWMFAALAVLVTTVLVRLAFGRLAGDYQTGLQLLNETAAKPSRSGRRWLDRLVNTPPLSWWLRGPTERAGFLLAAAYLIRDRDVKLRVYPGIAPMLILPVIFLLPGHGTSGTFGAAFSGAYLGLVPLSALDMLQYSQQWQAADIFRLAPISGPAPLCHGARRAVLLLLTLPVLAAFAGIVWVIHSRASWCLFLPGIVALPVYSLVPALFGRAAPLSLPVDGGRTASRPIVMIGMMITSVIVAAVASFAWDQGWFWPMLLVETIVAGAIYIGLRLTLDRLTWKSGD